ncbi:hypothetical protein DASB73_025500 [Starmerella bacillaris]|uniref:Spindle pole body component n=1 Tax=Starmerella bacillaris TaxID=1247836 RepID=A0AAV5RK38_STABA|nr:hypothetical protein DASB73_025500 [Starmerella bacillaris]
MDPLKASLFQDLPVILRGSSTDKVQFKVVENRQSLSVSSSVPIPLASVFLPLCSSGLYYSEIEKVLNSNAGKSSLYMQSLLRATRSSLESYLKVVQLVEAEVCKPYTEVTSLQAILLPSSFYLRTLLSILREVLRNSSLEDNICMNAVYRYTLNGDPLISNYASSIYDAIFATFSSLLKNWEDQGSLDLDVFEEFFVSKVDKSHKRYDFVLHEEKVPQGFSMWKAKEAFEKGKALYFVRTVCGFNLYDGSGRTCEEVCAYAYELLVNKFHLHLHIRGLRDYMFLANGNYTEGLFRNDTQLFMMESLANTKPSDIGGYLLSAFDDLKGSLKEDPKVFSQIDGKLVNFDDPEGKRNWEGFVCCYYMPSLPLSLIIDSECIQKYERCFAVLFRIRFSFYYITYCKAILQTLYHESMPVEPIMQTLRRFFVPMASIQQAFYYEKIDTNWTKFQNILLRDASKFTLDTIKSAHNDYLDSIVNAVASPQIFQAIDNAARQTYEFLQLIRDLESGALSTAYVDSETKKIVEQYLVSVGQVPL